MGMYHGVYVVYGVHVPADKFKNPDVFSETDLS